MKKPLISLLVAAAVGITAAGLVASEYGDREREHDGEDHEDAEHGYAERKSRSSFLSDPRYAIYQTECGDCHLAYPPSMLPAPSWRRVMGSLSDHFGDNAELDAATTEQITGFLTDNGASKGKGEYGERAWRATLGQAPPLRITQTDYFRGQHHEIPAKMVTDNPGVGSFSRCEACHSGAEQGGFSEREVRIPGVGRWDD
jgi:hypothetical protein